MGIPDRLREKLRQLPDKPGCYLMRDRGGRIVYVGKAVSLRKRVQSYFRATTMRRADPKLRGLLHSVEDVEWVTARTEAEAILTEARLIKEYKPRYNVDFRDDKRFLLLRADPAQRFPVFKPCRIRKDDGVAYFGPYTSSNSARAALDFVEKRFGLRRCQPVIPDATTRRHCLNEIIRYCCAPCIGKATEQDYRERFVEACLFLDGKRPRYLEEMKTAMREAAAAHSFEKAAAIRDTWFRIADAVKQSKRMASSPGLPAGDAKSGADELGRILGLRGVASVIEAFDVSNISGTFAVASMVCAVDGMPQGNRYRRFRIRTAGLSDDTAMMAEVIKRRYARVMDEKKAVPDLVLVDGGEGQAAAARVELDKLGLRDVPVVGLAKRLESVHIPGRHEPLTLDRNSAALKVLMRLRDEAHRFALAYHLRLRNRRIRDSALDEIPGVGAHRKERLLLEFHSVDRLRKASEDEIARVPGIGYEMARAIKAALSGAGTDDETSEDESGNTGG